MTVFNWANNTTHTCAFKMPCVLFHPLGQNRKAGQCLLVGVVSILPCRLNKVLHDLLVVEGLLTMAHRHNGLDAILLDDPTNDQLFTQLACPAVASLVSRSPESPVASRPSSLNESPPLPPSAS